MTDTTTEDAVSDDVTTEVEPAGDATPDVAAEAAKAAKARNREALETRLLIPLLLPILAMIAVALWALNVSRVFLAGDSTSALVIASIITVGDPVRRCADLGHPEGAHVVARDGDRPSCS